jgi:hypothetical protein
MDSEVVEQKIEELKEKLNDKLDEIVVKIEEKASDVTDEVLDKTQDAVADATEKASDAVVAAIESNETIQKIEALIESNSQAKAAVESIESAFVKEVDGRVFNCGCFGWLFSLRITRQNKKTPPATSSPKTDKDQPLQSTQVSEWSPPKSPVPSS